jgi:hypothetical protein
MRGRATHMPDVGEKRVPSERNGGIGKTVIFSKPATEREET